MDLRKLRRTALLRFSSAALVLGAILFGSAGTFRYWEASFFLATLFIPVTLAARYFLRHEPELLRRRLQAREKRTQQKTIHAAASVLWLVTFLIPGLDQRFGWSTVPAPLVVAADIMVLAGYLIVFLTLRENRFASRTIQVEEGQTVITSGPYAIVRHPMYVGVGLMLLFSPLALGSYWALFPAAATPFVLVMRIRDEEEALLEELPGYRQYTEKAKHRLIPRVW